MAKTLSNMLPLGTVAPEFNLFEPLTGKVRSLSELKSNQATVIMFICNHCPFVILLKEKLVELSNAYQAKGVSFIAINSNDVKNYPDDSPERMIEDVKRFGYTFPYLFDESQLVAKAYDAACTPDIYVFDSKLKCVYRGQFDDARPGNGIAPSGTDLSAALDAVLAGVELSVDQMPSMGCNIKWIESLHA